MNNSNDPNGFDRIAKLAAEKLADEMKRNAENGEAAEVPESLDARMNALFSEQKRKISIRNRIRSVGAAAAVVLLVSLCCLRQSLSPGDSEWSYEIGKKFTDTAKPSVTTDGPLESDTDIEADVSIDSKISFVVVM